MNPSEENKQESTPPEKKKITFRIIALLSLLIFAIAGGAFFFYPASLDSPTPADISSPNEVTPVEEPLSVKNISEESTVPPGSNPEDASKATPDKSSDNTDTILEGTSEVFTQKMATDEDSPKVSSSTSIPVTMPGKASNTNPIQKVSICNKPAQQLDDFYKHLDSQAYMADFKIGESSEEHFTSLIHKLLANPPQVTRETDDLYTILKNTAHFFRISGKDNIFMLQGILNNEKASVEQILADYYELVTTPECNKLTYTENINHDALYEYACFFLNTMGGRLYLFRRDSLSRMVVTYYAILLVERANILDNNRHGIALRPVVNMLISEMETGGSSLKHSNAYLDTLYDLKEKYQ